MPQADEAAVERLKREIALDRARLAMAMQLAEQPDPSGTQSASRLFQVFVAMGQA